ncbi:MAG: gliding motility-associated C-terminal domain-containing protein [Bacteroidetes bacterium]|nr:gliding motility-associated C-terminal domain-containing protein [Bacteroidota bacterium]MBV6462331.1 hypothetical protein [Flavobacteriales bacterium]WKZ74343.1 MAG: gliding motility-associated C-terminal domain-containing protein [Vicingaceae bacterium]NOG94741.1 gliding motility-associated C-terminal domain-containing protein [Bacteroidota bacterium]CAG0986434.1 hypothetical protein FLAV_02063 [Flavobacteriales bacterium]
MNCRLITILLSFAICILNSVQAKAQSEIEYVTNGSFEDIDTCYGQVANLGQDLFTLSGCTGWSNPIYSSSDLLCPVSWFPNTPPNFPGIGYQYPRTGNNIAGIVVGGGGIMPSYREYIQNKLQYTLKSNITYTIEFYISVGEQPCELSQIGVKFFNQQYTDYNAYQLTNYTADAENDVNNFIDDTLGWKKITLQYKANGTENFMIIGCFQDSTQLVYRNCDTAWWNPDMGVQVEKYYFIDDVSVQEALPEIFIPNVFSPNGDGINDFFEIKTNIAQWNCVIYNRWGQTVATLNEQNFKWNGGNNSAGSYYYVFTDTENLYPQTGFITLFK